MWRRYHLSDRARNVPSLFFPTGVRKSSIWTRRDGSERECEGGGGEGKEDLDPLDDIRVLGEEDDICAEEAMEHGVGSHQDNLHDAFLCRRVWSFGFTGLTVMFVMELLLLSQGVGEELQEVVGILDKLNIANFIAQSVVVVRHGHGVQSIRTQDKVIRREASQQAPHLVDLEGHVRNTRSVDSKRERLLQLVTGRRVVIVLLVARAVRVRTESSMDLSSLASLGMDLIDWKRKRQAAGAGDWSSRTAGGKSILASAR
jgi:hypothetical protein